MTDQTNPTELTEETLKPSQPTKAKTKKKKSKAGKKPAQKRPQIKSDSVKQPTEEPTPEQTVFSLPIQPDEWFIQPGTKDEAGNQLTEDTFLFLYQGQEIIRLPFTENNFSGLITVLRNSFPEEDVTPDRWNIALPLNDDLSPDPVMTLTKNGRLLAATSLDQASLKKMVRSLNRHIIKPPTINKRLANWWLKHKVWRVIVSILMLPIVFILIYTFVWGFTK